jgi:hypothetical protein
VKKKPTVISRGGSRMVFNGKVQGIVIGDGISVTTHNGEVTSVNGRSGNEWERRRCAALALGESESIAQAYAAAPDGAWDAYFMHRYGRMP